jgi:superfamily II DNA or RNA helicase/phage repressor protein C with HTH and peptisase S24 domain
MLLQELGAEVKIFESNNTQSFHMKAYIFTRQIKGTVLEGCAFVGSSNISQSALQTGLEWNLRINHSENPGRFETIAQEFGTVFSAQQSKVLTHKWIDAYISRRPNSASMNAPEAGADEHLPPPEPNNIQTAALLALQHSREKGYCRGLVVMGTGLGKTWLAAFDTQELNAKRVLFVAHREEILTQAEHTFVRIRPNVKIGKYTGRVQQLNVDMLFASIQTIGNQRHLDNFPMDYFDYIIIDEFHHAAARTYQKLLSHFRPRFLLGLTATPDRTDCAEILSFCDDNLVFSCDLFDGITADLLSPFAYFGIGDDSVDYQEISWRNGRFDVTQLSNQLATQVRAQHNFDEWKNKGQSRSLAFCVSKRHADFMAEFFNRKGIKSVAVYSDSSVRRNEALDQLKEGHIQVLFSVDLFNEGVDLPSIDTVLMLRPTESKVLFLQQLGRGLRKSNDTGKKKLVVIDFIGNHISFFRKAEGLFNIGATNADRKGFINQVEQNRLELPSGCFVNYDLKAIDFMKKLTNLRADVQEDRYTAIKESMGRRPSLSEFYLAGGAVETIRREHGQWLSFVAKQGDLTTEEEGALQAHRLFYKELELTRLSKSFKLVLLEALIENDGFKGGVRTDKLAEQSFAILHRRVNLLPDLPSEFSFAASVDASKMARFHKYWLDNPINAWIGGNSKDAQTFFIQQDNRFQYKGSIAHDHYNAFMLLAQEITSYRFLQYEQRLEQDPGDTITNFSGNTENDNSIRIPFFSDLRIACGHFSTSRHDTDNIHTKSLPNSYGRLDPARHFIARARGNSMNGGKNPIQNGDYLLLELITADSAGSNNNQIIAIERQDTSGEDQYLLRYVTKSASGSYQLQAFNPDYAPLPATEEMRTFARFKKIIDPADMLLHQQIAKKEVAGWFGMEYQEGLWKMSGHVCPKNTNAQFLFITLNKQTADPNYQYHDYFRDRSHFHWQSQNSTTPTNKKGLEIINHLAHGSRLHLFVRKHPSTGSSASPFYYCGEVLYQSHTGSGPMNVEYNLKSPLPHELYEYFS